MNAFPMSRTLQREMRGLYKFSAVSMMHQPPMGALGATFARSLAPVVAYPWRAQATRWQSNRTRHVQLADIEILDPYNPKKTLPPIWQLGALFSAVRENMMSWYRGYNSASRIDKDTKKMNVLGIGQTLYMQMNSAFARWLFGIWRGALCWKF